MPDFQLWMKKEDKETLNIAPRETEEHKTQ